MRAPSTVIDHRQEIPLKAEPHGSSKRTVALITDSETEAGTRIARAVSTAGVTCVLHYRDNGEKAGDLLHEIVASGGRALAFQSPVEDGRQVASTLAAVTAISGPISTLVLQGVFSGHARPVEDERWSILAAEIAPPLREALIWTHTTLPMFRTNGGGRIVGVWTGRRGPGASRRVGRAAWEALLTETGRELEGLGVATHVLRASTFSDRTRHGLQRSRSLGDAVLECLGDRGRARNSQTPTVVA